MPGVGAFPVKPTVDGEPNGIEAIGELIRGVAEHFGNALEPRERLRQIVWTSSERSRKWPGGGLILVPTLDAASASRQKATREPCPLTVRSPRGSNSYGRGVEDLRLDPD